MTERNGQRDRVLTTKAGDLELAIPKLRKGSFFPWIPEPRRCDDQALYAVVMEAYGFFAFQGWSVGSRFQSGLPA